MMNKKIVFVSSPTAGGAERMTLLYAKILQSHGYDCSMLLTCFKQNKILLPDFIPHTIPYKCIICSHVKLLKYQLAWYIFREKADIVFCSQPANAIRLLELKKAGLIKAKIIFRDFLMPSTQLDRFERLNVSLYSHSDAVIAQTQEMKEEMVNYYKLSPDLITVINNPIDKELIQESIREKFDFDKSYINYIAINRVDRQKDLLTMLKAFAEVKVSCQNVRLYICGNCSDALYKQELDSFITLNGLSDCVFFEGPQPNPFKYLYYADVFLLSSVYEGLPNGMLEAMYLGKPVVVTHSIPFIKQVVNEGINGFTTAVGDAHAFASAMIKAQSLKIEAKFVDVCNSEKIICDFFDDLFHS